MEIKDTEQTQIAYMAGFFDGEGSITIYIHPKHRPSYLIVSMAQANYRILRELQLRFGGSVYGREIKTRVYWQWRLSSQKAIRFLTSIYPYLKLKKAEAEVAFAFQNGKHPRGNRLTQKEQEIENTQAILMRKLKDKASYC